MMPANRWKPIETAPKDGTVFLAYVLPNVPQFVVWAQVEGEPITEKRGWGPFRRTVTVGHPPKTMGWRIAVWGLRLGWGVMNPCDPKHWMPLPNPPSPSPEG